MFDSILKRNTLPKPKYGIGLGIALSLHAAALFGALWLPTKPLNPTPHTSEVILYKSLPPTGARPLAVAAPPSPPLSPTLHSQTPPLQRNKTKPLTKPKAAPTTMPLEKEPDTTPAKGGDTPHPYGENQGPPGTNPDAPFGSATSAASGPWGGPAAYNLSVLPFGEGMTPPKPLRHHPVRFSQEALEARVEGLAVVRCTITAQGDVKNCRFIQRLPFMDEAILSALYRRKYSPASYQGQHISVDYNIPIRLKLP